MSEEFLSEVEKADPVKGVIQMIVYKSRPDNAAGQVDRDNQGLDGEAAAEAMGEWVANFGTYVDYFSPNNRRFEKRWCGIYDTHQKAAPADLLGAWWFPDEGVYRILFRPHNRQVAVDAAKGLITGASWAGLAQCDVIEEDEA